MQKFFTKTVESKFIKNLLYNYPLPLYKTVRDGDYIVSPIRYIYNESVIRCTSSGLLNTIRYTWDAYKLKPKVDLDNVIPDQLINLVPSYLFMTTETIYDIKHVYLYSTEKGEEEVHAQFTVTNPDDIISILYSDEIEVKHLEDTIILSNPKTLIITSEMTAQDVNEILSTKYIQNDFQNSEIQYVKEISRKEDRFIYANICKITYQQSNTYVESISSDLKDQYPEYGKQGIYWYVLVDIVPTAKYDVLDTFIFGTNYKQLTERHISEFGYYDSDTHEALGKYLRCIRDIYKLNLLPLYNCYSGRTIQEFYIKKNRALSEHLVPNKMMIMEDYILDHSKWEFDEIRQKYSYEIDLTNGSAEYISRGVRKITNKDPEESKLTWNIEEDIAYVLRETHPGTKDLKLDLTVMDYKKSEIWSFELINKHNTNYKILQIPIQFNTTYTICIDSDSEIIMTPVFLKNNRLVTAYDENKQPVDVTALLNKKITVVESPKFKRPFTYSLDLLQYKNKANFLAANEKNLYLLLQTFNSEDSSVMVLEGDFTRNQACKKYYEGTILNDLSDTKKDWLFQGPLSLTKLSDYNQYAFSDRLLEYLSLNVVTHLDNIENNIKYLQDMFEIDNNRGTYGIWNDLLRSSCYKFLLKNTSIEHYDQLGYADKDVYKILG